MIVIKASELSDSAKEKLKNGEECEELGALIEKALNGRKDGDAPLYALIDKAQLAYFNRLLGYKLEWAKVVMKEAVDIYTTRQESIKQRLFYDLIEKRKKEEVSPYPPVYWFELTTFAPGDWGMTKISPWPPDFMTYYENLSPDVIAGITDIETYPIDTEEIYLLDNVEAGMLNKRLDVRFVRCASNHVIGTVTENIEWIREMLENPGDPSQWDEETAFRKFFQYLYDYPAFHEEFIEAFETELLPRLKEEDAREAEETGDVPGFHLPV